MNLGDANRSGRRAGRRFDSARYKRSDRRRKLLERIAHLIPPRCLSPKESFQLLFGSPQDAHQVLKRARYLLLPGQMEAPYSETSRNIGAEQISVTRPTRVLSRANRSTVFPPLLSEAMQVEAVSASDILDVLRRDHSKTPPHRLLDALAFSSGLSWQTSAELLFAAELVQKKIDTDDVATTRCARTFWILYAIGREHYSRLTAEGVVPRLRGNWAWFSAQDFAALLPSAVIPRKLKRHQYLTNWVDDRGRFFLDVHDGSAAAPLFQHPFPNEFNPLVFGKSRKS